MNIIAAVDKNWAIGKNNELLVRIPMDQKFFRETTTGKVVVMGRKTLESFPNGLPLKNRTNIVLTHNLAYQVKDAIVVHSMEELHRELEKYDTNDVYVIGGQKIYEQLLDEIENVLGIRTCPINWPIGAGKRFKGVYDRDTKKVSMFQAVSVGGAKSAAETDYDVTDPALKDAVGDELYAQLMDEIELLDGASDEFDQELVDKGELSPVFFGSALTTFGVQTFLEHFLKMTQSPLPRMSDAGLIDPITEPFSGFVFKIQANMNKAHHDRIAFMRISSGKFDATKEVYHVQSGRKLRLSQPQQIMAQDRKVIDEAYAGDVIGVFDPGIFSIGDTLCTPGKKFQYEGIPTFAPEHFCRLVHLDSMKRKQFIKGVTQIAQEGAIQMFQDYTLGMSEIIVGVVGVLQFDVLKYRLENEYGCDIRLEPLPYNYIRWVKDPSTDLNKLSRISDCKKVKDMKDNPLLLFANEWSIRLMLEHNEGLELEEFRKN